MKGISSLISTRTESVSQEKSNDLNDNPVAEHASMGSNMYGEEKPGGPPMMSKGPKATRPDYPDIDGDGNEKESMEQAAADKKEGDGSPLEKRRTKAERQANRAEKRKKKADRLSKGTAAQKNRAARIRGRAERSKIKQSDGSRGEKLDAQQKSRDKQKSSQTDLDSETGKKYKSRRGLEKGGENESKTDLTKYAPKKDKEKKPPVQRGGL